MSGRRRFRAQDGVTVAEMSVASALVLVVLAVFGSQLTTATRATTELNEHSRAVDEAKLAFNRIEREVRAAVQVRTPAVNASGDVLEMTTYTGSGGALRWARYEIDGDGTLLRSDGGNGFAASPVWGPPATVAEHVVATGATFTMCPRTAARDLVTVLLDLQVRVDDSHGVNRLESQVAVRNSTGAAQVGVGVCA